MKLSKDVPENNQFRNLDGGGYKKHGCTFVLLINVFNQ